jgi:hypothetical protein
VENCAYTFQSWVQILLAVMVAQKESHPVIMKPLMGIDIDSGSCQLLLHLVLPRKPRASDHCAVLRFGNILCQMCLYNLVSCWLPSCLLHYEANYALICNHFFFLSFKSAHSWLVDPVAGGLWWHCTSWQECVAEEARSCSPVCLCVPYWLAPACLCLVPSELQSLMTTLFSPPENQVFVV